MNPDFKFKTLKNLSANEYLFCILKELNRGRYSCQCKCGNIFELTRFAILSGKIRSCGCLRKLINEEDLSGEFFAEGKIQVLKKLPLDNWGNYRYECKCLYCDKVFSLSANKLKRGHYSSCGCQKSVRLKILAFKHGLGSTKIYKTYYGMKDRCYNKEGKAYKDWGGRGITICQEWLEDFFNFYTWAISNGYKPGLTIERIDNNGNYEPSNCEWKPKSKQGGNTRLSIRMQLNEEWVCASQAATIIGIVPPSTYLGRLSSGKWNALEALVTKTCLSKVKLGDFKTKIRLELGME